MIVYMGSEHGSVRPGDKILCRGYYTTVTEVKVHEPDTHPNSPIVSSMFAVEAVTAYGSRWAGATMVGNFVGAGALWDRRGHVV